MKALGKIKQNVCLIKLEWMNDVVKCVQNIGIQFQKVGVETYTQIYQAEDALQNIKLLLFSEITPPEIK